jgi:diguanylate cyclase (GGDEF)-like protein
LNRRIEQLLEARRNEQRLRDIAFNDSLTGLPNRKLFTIWLKELIAHSIHSDQHIAILFIDLDRFKMVNETMGHDAGDMLLKTVAERIRNCVRSIDLVARLGDDEFTVVLHGLSSRNVIARIAQKICNSLSRPFSIMGKTMFITTSIGISICPEDETEIAVLMKYADTTMFRAKEGGSRYRFYELGMEKASARRLELGNDLRKVLTRDQLRVHYQPQMNLRSGRIPGMEALLRWIHPAYGNVSPTELIPLAKENGMIHEIGNWVLQTARKENKAWLDHGFGPLQVLVPRG